MLDARGEQQGGVLDARDEQQGGVVVTPRKARLEFGGWAFELGIDIRRKKVFFFSFF